MNILVIKQTSLGDVLHASVHIKAIKNKYPKAHLTVLTATHCQEIYAHNPHIDRLVLFDYSSFKRLGLSCLWTKTSPFTEALYSLNNKHYDLAFDLQGLWRSVYFLYRVHAKRKFVKGRWWGLSGFKNKNLHAIDEMTKVLNLAQIPVTDTQMQFERAPDVAPSLFKVLNQQNINKLPNSLLPLQPIIISPFTRWVSKNWPLESYIQLAVYLCKDYPVIVTAEPHDKINIDNALQKSGADTSKIINLAGALSLSELAELMANAQLVISGDSFPMHLATAVKAPVISLFGPTDENKTGSYKNHDLILRPDNCKRCDNPNCKNACLSRISVEMVYKKAKTTLGQPFTHAPTRR